MTSKCALVVDDSRSARAALKKLLENHALQVLEADSGESAIDLLKRERVDVIFMDHTMPGMDGLETVSAIKTNPRTATIPVMMYTAKEGGVYVGQARALGAVGVLPKNAQPHLLSEMLMRLNIIPGDAFAATAGETPKESSALEPSESVANEWPSAGSTDDSELTDAVEELDRALESQALKMSVQAIVTRTLEQQHMTLRADILRSQQDLARQVAREILDAQSQSAAQAEPQALRSGEGVSKAKRGRSWVLGFAVVAALVSTLLAWQFKQQRDLLQLQLKQIQSAQTQTQSQTEGLNASLERSKVRAARALEAALIGFSRALSAGTDTAMYAPAFSSELAQRVEDLWPAIQRAGFAGTLTLTSHLGNFCLVIDATGNYQLAPDELPLNDCTYLGHVLENDSDVVNRLSPRFGGLMSVLDEATPGVNLVALTLAESDPLVAYPATGTARSWNAAAQLNNRVTVSFE